MGVLNFSIVLNYLKIIFYCIVRSFKRAMCCFRRRRRNSSETVVLTGIGIVPAPYNSADTESWAQWDENSPSGLVSVISDKDRAPPSNIQQHIEFYRQQTIAARMAEEAAQHEPDEDYFEDMTPKLTKQRKVLLKPENAEENGAASLSLNMQVAPLAPLVEGGELGEWEESPGWDEEGQFDGDFSVDAIVREKRRLEREKRMADQQQKRLERQSKTFATRLS